MVFPMMGAGQVMLVSLVSFFLFSLPYLLFTLLLTEEMMRIFLTNYILNQNIMCK